MVEVTAAVYFQSAQGGSLFYEVHFYLVIGKRFPGLQAFFEEASDEAGVSRVARRSRHLMGPLLSGDRREEIVAHLEQWLAASREVPDEMFLSTLRLLRRWTQA